MTVTERPAVDAPAPLLLPAAPRRFGPVTRLLLARFVVGVLAVEVIGTALLVATRSHAAHALGTSLVFPGAGLLYDASPGLFALNLVAMVVALVLWWGASAHVAIPLVWFGGAGLAAWLADGPRVWVHHATVWPWAVVVAYVLLVGAATTAVPRIERSFRAKRAKVAGLNEYLATATAPERRPWQRTPDAADAELLRWCYDLADQPADGLDGLDWGDQFHSGTQLRYQLNALCWAVSVFAANFVPNAPTQARDALIRLIDKHTDLRVWSYWRTLNLLGNFDADPDPIKRDNIMFSAFLGDVLNIFEAATGSDHYDHPGSLTFVWKDGRTFEYDHHSLVDAVEANYRRSRLGFFPCEPGWAFTVCNIMGAQSLYGHDTLHGTQAWQRVQPSWVRTLDDEYLTPDGSYAHIKSTHLGLSWDTGEVPGGHYFANGSNRFADILPDHARRAAALERRGAEAKIRGLATLVRDGRLELELPAELERHRARRSALSSWVRVIGGAQMMGEDALADAALDAAVRQCATGKRWPDRPLDSSVPGIGGFLIVRWSAPLGTADLNRRGYVAPVGPVLADTAWADVLVVEARSPDGVALDVRLEPRREPVPTLSLSFAALEAGRTYRLVGAEPPVALHASADGTAAVAVALAGPLQLRLEPVASS